VKFHDNYRTPKRSPIRTCLSPYGGVVEIYGSWRWWDKKTDKGFSHVICADGVRRSFCYGALGQIVNSAHEFLMSKWRYYGVVEYVNRTYITEQHPNDVTLYRAHHVVVRRIKHGHCYWLLAKENPLLPLRYGNKVQGKLRIWYGSFNFIMPDNQEIPLENTYFKECLDEQ